MNLPLRATAILSRHNQEVIPMPAHHSPKSENREALDRLFRRLVSDFGAASGRCIIRTILEELGSLRVTIPGIQDFEREDRDRRIRSAFNGHNYEELALRFGLSSRQVRYIIDSERAPGPPPAARPAGPPKRPTRP